MDFNVQIRILQQIHSGYWESGNGVSKPGLYIIRQISYINKVGVDYNDGRIQSTKYHRNYLGF